MLFGPGVSLELELSGEVKSMQVLMVDSLVLPLQLAGRHADEPEEGEGRVTHF